MGKRPKGKKQGGALTLSEIKRRFDAEILLQEKLESEIVDLPMKIKMQEKTQAKKHLLQYQRELIEKRLEIRCSQNRCRMLDSMRNEVLALSWYHVQQARTENAIPRGCLR